MYAEVEDLRIACGYEEGDEESLPIEKAEAALIYAQGLIGDFCNTTFEGPEEDTEYLMDGNGAASLFAPSAGPFSEVSKVEYYGTDWTEYTGDYWLKHGGEVLKLGTRTCPGNLNWRITAKCFTELSEYRQAMLVKATLMIARMEVIPRDMPLGPSVRNISTEGLSYSYQPLDQGHPTGIDEVDHILRALRRSMVAT